MGVCGTITCVLALRRGHPSGCGPPYASETRCGICCAHRHSLRHLHHLCRQRRRDNYLNRDRLYHDGAFRQTPRQIGRASYRFEASQDRTLHRRRNCQHALPCDRFRDEHHRSHIHADGSWHAVSDCLPDIVPGNFVLSRGIAYRRSCL